jgi:phosphoribosylformylglycinamidine synthase II
MTKTTTKQGMAALGDVDVTNADVASEVGLKGDEWDRAQHILGRVPNKVELGCISAMWSEHCSYKSSRMHLRNLPTTGPKVIIGPGENAGVVDVGGGKGVCFKVESHNHPSFIEPYQGAATGAGGILRDVFTMGARPFAAGNLFRFGRASHQKTPQLLRGVVKGVGDYGNCFGVPTVWTDARFDASYDGNILVNALAIGVVDNDAIFLGRADGVGNPVFYVGAKTGRDGIHGATMASDAFSDDKEVERPTVQVGDPFKEKLLLEACLEAMKTGALTGIQDMGAAGLTSSTFEMASRAGNGVRLDLDRVPVRERAMSAYEIMLSESQERMLLVATKGHEAEVRAVFERWDLDCTEVGVVTDDGLVRLVKEGREVAVLPARELADEAPRYDRPRRRRAPATIDPRIAAVVEKCRSQDGIAETFRALLASPNVGSRRFILEQFDREVGVGTLKDCAAGAAAVVQVPGTAKAISVALLSNNHACALDPREGARRTVVEGMLRAAAVGARPLAVSDCLNYGNPENPEVMEDIVDGILGIADACLALETPVVSGNVSLYNDTDGRSVQPTPSIAFLGLVDDARVHVSMRAMRGDTLLLVGALADELASAEVLNLVDQAPRSTGLHAIDLAGARALGQAVVDVIERGLVRAARPVVGGGLAVAAVEMALASDVGVQIAFEETNALQALFGESRPAIVLAVDEGHVEAVTAALRLIGIRHIGRVIGDEIALKAGTTSTSLSLVEARSLWESTMPSLAARVGGQ